MAKRSQGCQERRHDDFGELLRSSIRAPALGRAGLRHPELLCGLAGDDGHGEEMQEAGPECEDCGGKPQDILGGSEGPAQTQRHLILQVCV